MRKELNFSNEITEIPSAWIREIDEVPKGEVLERKKLIVATKLPKFKDCEEREKKDCSNKVAKIQGERGKKKGNEKNKKFWQPSCGKWE